MSPDHHHITDPHTGRGSLHPHGSMEPHGAQLQEVPLLEIDHVTSGYETGPVIQDVSIKIWRGQFVAVVGPNGGGKTTLLRTILGTSRRTGGKVALMGQPATAGSLW